MRVEWSCPAFYAAGPKRTLRRFGQRTAQILKHRSGPSISLQMSASRPQPPSPAPVRGRAASVRALLPRGGSLPDDEFERRHRGLVWLLWASAVGMPAYSLVVGWPILHSALHGATVVVLALAASLPRFGRKQRSVASSVGLMTSA